MTGVVKIQRIKSIIIKSHTQSKMQKLTAAIIASVAQANYLSGEVRSQEWFHYGKFVVRMQNPGKMGTVQSFFTYTA